MWEDLTIALSCIGVMSTLVLILVELIAVLDGPRKWDAARRDRKVRARLVHRRAG